MIKTKGDRETDAQYESENKVRFGEGNVIRWVEFKELKNQDDEDEFGTIRLYKHFSGSDEDSKFTFQLRAKCPLVRKATPRNLMATVSLSIKDLETFAERARVMDYDTLKFRIKIPSSLETIGIAAIIKKAEDIAAETFIKQGNKAVGFTDNDDLRIMMGGKFKSFPELSKIVIKAYNEKLSDLILTNL